MNLNRYDPETAIIEFAFLSEYTPKAIQRIEKKTRQHVRKLVDLSVDRDSEMYSCIMTFDSAKGSHYFLVMVWQHPELGDRIDVMEADPMLSEEEVRKRYDAWMERMNLGVTTMIDPEAN